MTPIWHNDSHHQCENSADHKSQKMPARRRMQHVYSHHLRASEPRLSVLVVVTTQASFSHTSRSATANRLFCFAGFFHSLCYSGRGLGAPISWWSMLKDNESRLSIHHYFLHFEFLKPIACTFLDRKNFFLRSSRSLSNIWTIFSKAANELSFRKFFGHVWHKSHNSSRAQMPVVRNTFLCRCKPSLLSTRRGWQMWQ